LLLAGLLVACTSKPKNGEANDNEKQQSAISDEVKTFTSPDLALNQIHSKIDHIVTTTYTAKKEGDQYTQGKLEKVDTIYFDNDGKMIRKSSPNEEELYNYNLDGTLNNAFLLVHHDDSDSKYVIKVKRDVQKYITDISYYYAGTDESFNFKMYYTWQNGALATSRTLGWEWEEQTTYEYDADKLCLRDITNNYDQGTTTTITATYQYTAFDGCNNWTRRISTNEWKEEEWIPGTDETIKSEPQYFCKIQERQIVYQK
jgi:hypothetical protein